MVHTFDGVILEMTEDYLKTIDRNNPPTPDVIQEEVLDRVAATIRMENTVREKGERWKIPQRLLPAQIADVILTVYQVVNINFIDAAGDPEYDLLAIYQTCGPDKGIYVSDEQVFKRIIRQYSYTITEKEIKEVMAILKSKAERVDRTTDRDLVAVNNGIFDYKRKVLMPFDSHFVFIAKSRVDYNPNAYNITIHNDVDGTDWDVESWMRDLSDDTDIVDLLWELLGAIIRPNVTWDKSAWFFSTTGCNGKGSIIVNWNYVEGIS